MFGVAEDEADALGRETGIERHVSGVDLQHREHRDVGLGALVEQKPDAVAGGDALRDQMARELVGAAIELVIGQRDVVGDDGFAVGKAKTHLFESVVEPLPFVPAQRIVARDQSRRAHRRAADVFEHGRKVMRAMQMQPVAQLNDGVVIGWAATALADFAGMNCHCFPNPQRLGNVSCRSDT